MQKSNSLIYGVHALKEAVQAGKTIDKVLVDHHLKSKLGKEFKAMLSGTGTTISYVPGSTLDRLVKRAHQGVIAFISPIVFADLQQTIDNLYAEGKSPRLLMLDHITDVRNFGAILRSAECFGFHAVIVPEKGGAGINEDAVKSSAGALLKMPVCKVNNLHHELTRLQENGLEVVAISEHATQEINDRTYTKPLVLILGNEEKGIHPVMLKHADDQRKINMQGSLQSLNVSAAAAIALYTVSKSAIQP